MRDFVCICRSARSDGTMQVMVCFSNIVLLPHVSSVPKIILFQCLATVQGISR
jgi:hypothetical protein